MPLFHGPRRVGYSTRNVHARFVHYLQKHKTSSEFFHAGLCSNNSTAHNFLIISWFFNFMAYNNMFFYFVSHNFNQGFLRPMVVRVTICTSGITPGGIHIFWLRGCATLQGDYFFKTMFIQCILFLVILKSAHSGYPVSCILHIIVFT